MTVMISAHGARVLVEGAGPELVGRRLVDALAGTTIRPVSATPTGRIDARIGVRSDETTGELCVVRNGAAVHWTASPDDLVDALARLIRRELMVRARTVQFARAGAVIWRDRAIVILGERHAGTTSLVAELVRRGARLYADPFAGLDEHGSLHPGLSGSTPDGPPDGRGPTVVPVALIVTSYEPGTAWAPELVRGAGTALALLDHLIALPNDPRRRVRAAAALASNAITLRGPRPDAAEMAPSLLDLVDRVIDGQAPTRALAGLPSPATRSADAASILDDPGWVPVRVTREGRVRFRHFARPFHIRQAGKHAEPGDVVLAHRQIMTGTAEHTPARVVFVYHHGYAGSTLLARLLDQPGTCLVYDEPNVHMGAYADPVVRRLCYRVFQPGETPLIKALPGEIVHGQAHFEDHPDARAVFLYAPLEQYVASVLAHPYRRDYVTRLAVRLTGATPDDPAAAAAAAWHRIADEAIELATSHPLKTLPAAALYDDPVATLHAVWSWCGFRPRRDWDDTITRVTAHHAKSGRPFSFDERQAQQQGYADRARPWLDARQSTVSDARATADRLTRFGLPVDRRDPRRPR